MPKTDAEGYGWSYTHGEMGGNALSFRATLLLETAFDSVLQDGTTLACMWGFSGGWEDMLQWKNEGERSSTWLLSTPQESTRAYRNFSWKYFHMTLNMDACNPFARMRVLRPRPKRPCIPSFAIIALAASG